MKQDNNIAIEVLEAEITACEISRARKIVINENRKAAEMDKEITSLQHSIQTLSSTDKVIASGKVTGFYYLNKGDGESETLHLHTTNGDLKVDVSHMSEALELEGKHIEIILREVK